MNPAARAPRWVVALLSRVVPSDLEDEVVGDFEEVHCRRATSGSGAPAGLVSTLEGLGLVAYWAGVRVLRALGNALRFVSGTEVRLALRLVRKQPILNLTAVVALGVGIGMAAGAYSLFDQTLNGELPWEGGDRFAVLSTVSDETGDRILTNLDLERMRLIRSAAPAIQYLGAIGGGAMNVVYATGEIEPIAGARLTPGFFAFLPYVPLEGRLFSPGDGGAFAPAVVLIRESLWQRRFGGAQGVLGTDLNIGGVQHEIVGILPDEAGFPTNGEIWVPLDEESMGATSDRDPVGGQVLAILAPDATYEQASLQTNQLSARVSVAGSGVEAQRHTFRPLTELLLPGAQIQMLVLVTMGFLIAVLLLISFNVANLIMARTSSRAAELAVRSALGASRVRIVGQLFIEVLAITVIAGALGLSAAGGILAFYDRVMDELPFWVHLGISPGTVVVVGILSLLAAAVMGVFPGLRATRISTADAIRSSGRGGSLGVGRVGGGMIAVEVALSVALIGAAVIFWRAFQDYSEPGFHLPAERVLAAGVASVIEPSDLSEGGAATVSDSIRILAASLAVALNELPQVRAAAIASALPPVQPGQSTVQLEGQDELVTVRTVRSSPGLMETIEAEPLSGRFLGPEDMKADAPPVVVVNRAFALEHFGTSEVVGARLRTVPGADDEEPLPWRQIVGVVPDVMEVAAAGGGAGIYLPLAGQRFFYVAVLLDSDPLAFSNELRRVAFDMDPELAVAGVMRLEEVGSANNNAMKAISAALVGVGLIALLLSLAGVYSIVALSVTQRTREIGIRVALGAEPARILRPLLRRSGLLILSGSLVGAVLGSWAGQADGIFTFNLPDAGPLMFPTLIALMVLAGVAACWIPARRALSIHPVEALRYDA